jgi:hypothetical protein
MTIRSHGMSGMINNKPITRRQLDRRRSFKASSETKSTRSTRRAI